MKRLALLAIGLIPLPLGYILNRLLMTVYWDRPLPPLGMIGVAFLPTGYHGSTQQPLLLCVQRFTGADRWESLLIKPRLHKASLKEETDDETKT